MIHNPPIKNNLPLLFILLLATALRLYHLGSVPPGLFGDEVDAGYNAYSILKTGRDYNGNFFPIHFESYGDYRTPLYLYSIIPSVVIFGLTPFAIRFPAALFGILGILSTYLLIKELFSHLPPPGGKNLFANNAGKSNPASANSDQVGKKAPTKKKLITSPANTTALTVALLLAILPWHIHYSRAAFEVTLMYFLLTLGTYLFLKGTTSQKNSKTKPLSKYSSFWLTASAAIFALAPYSYNTAKLFTPLLIAGLIPIFSKTILQTSKKTLLLAFCTLLLVSAPMIYDSLLGAGQNRFGSINITNQPNVVPKINRQRGQHQDFSSLATKLLHNRPSAWGKLFLKNYFTSFSPQFLLFSQTNNARHAPQNSSQIFLWMIPFLLWGLYQAVNQRKSPVFQFALFWLLTAPLPAALTIGGGNHPTRLFILIFPLILFTSVGIVSFIQKVAQLKKPYKFAFYFLLFAFCLSSFVAYLDQYYTHYPLDSYRWWNTGFRQAIHYAQSHQDQFDQIIITKSYGPPLLHFLFHTQYDPQQFHQELNRLKAPKNLSPTPEHLGKYWFTTISPGDSTRPKNTLYLAAPWDQTQDWQELDTITTSDGTEVFKILYSGKN